jgi:P27 family predicted phage terminase small subunit
MAKKKFDSYTDLSLIEKRFFNQLSDHLKEIGLFSEADNVIITRTAKVMALLEQADKDLKKGQIQDFPNGTRQVSPEHTVYKNHLSTLVSLLKDLGLTPAARNRMKLDLTEKETDLMDYIVNVS